MCAGLRFNIQLFSHAHADQLLDCRSKHTYSVKVATNNEEDPL